VRLCSDAFPFRFALALTMAETLIKTYKSVGPHPEDATLPLAWLVLAGDSLSRIAQKVYGNASQWPKIHQANKASIGPDPNKLNVGTFFNHSLTLIRRPVMFTADS